MFKHTPEKYVRASNLILMVALLKAVNIVILNIIPNKPITLIVGLAIPIVLILALLMRTGFNWMRFLIIPFLVYSWIGVPTIITDTFGINPLAGILVVVQLIIPLMILEVLFNTQKLGFHNDRGRYAA